MCVFSCRKLIEGEDLRFSGVMLTMSLTSCSMSAIGSGMSFSGGGVGGVGGMGGGTGSVVGGMGAAPTEDMEDFPGRTGGANMGGHQGLRAGGGGVGAGIGDGGVNAGIGGGVGLAGGVVGIEGAGDLDTVISVGGVGAGAGGVDTRAAGDDGRGSTGIGLSDGDVSVVGGKEDGGQDLAKRPGNRVTEGAIGCELDGYDGDSEACVEQAVELTQRRTVLVR